MAASQGADALASAAGAVEDDDSSSGSGGQHADVERLVSPPFGGSDLEWAAFWGGWLWAPGVLVALQVVTSCAQEPWFVVYVAWMGERAAAVT
jgi:hypothetical protein